MPASGPASGPPPGTPAVSVLVAAYDAEPFIARMLASVLGQTLTDLEVIVVDDVSPDATPAIVEATARADPRVRLVRMAANRGPAAARNRAIAEARGRWLAIVDADDLVAPDRLRALASIGEDAGVDMIADDLLVFPDGQPSLATRFLAEPDRRSGMIDLDLAAYLKRSVLYGGEPNPGFLKPLIRRDRLLDAGVRYDERLRVAEDDNLMIRLLLAGLSYRLVGTPGYFYRKHDRSISHRLTVRVLDAMVASDRELARRVVAVRPDLAAAVRRRSASYARALAFERTVAAVKAGRLDRAAALIARHPAALPLWRMPIAGLLHRRRAASANSGPDGGADELAVLTALALAPIPS